MLNYQNAPYLELNTYKAPKGINCIFIEMDDGKKIRLAFWENSLESNKIKGTILLQQGHNEFIEKYYETIQELIDLKYDVVCFDWRGQGMSDRMLKSQNKQYIEDFSIHIEDMSFIVKTFIKENFKKPLFGIGHSMGGHNLLVSQTVLQKYFKAIVLSAPMLGFRYENLLFSLVNIMSYIGRKENYFPGSRPNMGKETPFSNNDLTSDYERYKRTQKLVRKNPSIRLWGITNAWVKAVKDSLLNIRKSGYLESIKTPILIVNPLKDRVVNPYKTMDVAQRLPNCKIFNVDNIEHEILMEKDQFRKQFWKIFNDFIEANQ
tara:strand:+ start:597 stop:1553 length:957 start_codon:yes stop_codon:yes gene_type:complete